MPDGRARTFQAAEIVSVFCEGRGAMAMTVYGIYRKFYEYWIRLHTAMVGRALGAYGGGGRIESPLVVNLPERVFVGKNPIWAAGVFLSCVTEWNGACYNGEIRMGDNCFIREGAHLSAASSIILGDGVSIARGSVICDHFHSALETDLHPYLRPLTKPKPVVIEDNCGIGAYAQIGPGVRVGKGSMIGQGCIILRDVPPGSVILAPLPQLVRQYDEELRRWQNLTVSRHARSMFRLRSRKKNGQT